LNHLLFGILLCFLLFNISTVNAQNEIELHLTEIWGAENPQYIAGQYKITAKSTIPLILMKLYFNDEYIKNTTTDTLIFEFDTSEFEMGIMNMTVVGWDQAGNQYQNSIIKTFGSTTPTITIIIIIGLIAGGIFTILILASRKKERKSVNKEDISIDLDKNLL
jgi:hypothetical protein